MTTDPDATIRSLRERITRYPIDTHPTEHATVQFNLGLALAEAPIGDRKQNLKSAIDAYAQALVVFHPEVYPVQRARVLTALGAAERDLGMRLIARDRFADAVSCLQGVEALAELGAAANNLGLVEADLGNHDTALAAFDRALEAFSGEVYLRQRAATLVNRGLVAAALDSVASLEMAVGDHQAALTIVDTTNAPYIYALAHHSLGVALMSLPEDRAAHLGAAISSLNEALTVFTRTTYPFQHALSRYNLALALFERAPADLQSQRRALAYLEETASLLDPRLHRPQWLEVRAALGRVEEALSSLGVVATRAEHFVTLLGEVSSSERLELLRYRLRWLLATPDPVRGDALAALDRVIVRTSADRLTAISQTWIAVLMEQPHDQLLAGLRSRHHAQSELSGPERLAALTATEIALGELEVIQRVRVRDLLTELGYERPE